MMPDQLSLSGQGSLEFFILSSGLSTTQETESLSQNILKLWAQEIQNLWVTGMMVKEDSSTSTSQLLETSASCLGLSDLH